MKNQAQRLSAVRPLFWTAVVWIFLIFATAGSSRSDMLSLVAIRPLAALIAAALIARLWDFDLGPDRRALWLMTAAGSLTALHLLPLPPGLWHALPQRDLIAAIDSAVGNQELWRPLSIAPPQTWNALLSLLVPATIALLMVRLTDTERRWLVFVFLALAAISIVVGVLQVSGGAASPFYVYRIHNEGAAIGLFANRNHHAVFLASCLPLLAFVANRQDADQSPTRMVRTVALGFGAVIVLMLVLIGSRAGVLAGLVGLASVLLIAQPDPRNTSRRAMILGAGLVGVAAIVAISVFASRAESLYRLLGSDDIAEGRVETFAPLVELAKDQILVGTGLGTFVEAYQRIEPDRLLEPRYFNHAHNDYLELAITAGIPGLLLLAATLGLLAAAGITCLKDRRSGERPWQLRTTAVSALVVLALASVADYPLRVPSLMAYATFLLIIALHRPARGGG